MHCCTLTNDGLHLILWSLSSLCNNVFCVHIKASTPISEWNSLLPHNLIPHRCYDLGEWYFIAHGVEGSLYGLTNALEEITYLVSRLLHTEFPSLFPINATMASWSTPSIFSILYWFCLQNCTVRAVYKNRISPDQLMDHSFLSHNYTRRDVVSHHVQACANMSCFEISLPNTLFRTVIRYSVVFWFVRPDVEPILNTLWVEKEKHQKIYILSIRVVDFVKDNETAASTISISAYPLACTTLHPFLHN